MISPVFALTIEFLNFGAKKDGEELYGGVVFFVFSNALEEYDVDGFFVGGLESIDGRRTVLRTPPFPPLDELKGLLFVSLRSPAMLNVFVFFLISYFIHLRNFRFERFKLQIFDCNYSF